jgi:ribonuclease Z
VFQVSRGQALAYVTDVADHRTNRARVVRLAADADHLFIETAFLHRDRAPRGGWRAAGIAGPEVER